MSLNALVYKNRSLSEGERALIGSVDGETGQPLLREGDSFYDEFAAKEVFIGNLFGVAALRRELEKNAPEMSESIRETILLNGTLSGVGFSEPHVSRIATECANLLSKKPLELSDSLRGFLTNLSELAKTALIENNPIALV